MVDIKPSNVPKFPLLLFLPYLGVYSIHPKQRLTKFIGKIYPMLTLRLFFGLINLLVAFFPFKDRVPSHVCSSVVYKFTCSSCQATNYGKTSRHFIVRCREHLGIRKSNSVKGASSAIKDHVKDTGHSASLDDFCIIYKANNELELLIHESLLIPKDRPTLNFQSSSIPLCLF